MDETTEEEDEQTDSPDEPWTGCFARIQLIALIGDVIHHFDFQFKISSDLLLPWREKVGWNPTLPAYDSANIQHLSDAMYVIVCYWRSLFVTYRYLLFSMVIYWFS
jgi:hypothetical protein